MSFRNPFSKLHPSSKKTAISRTTEREFEKEFKKLEQLEEDTKKIHKDAKRCIDSQTAQAKCETRIAADLQTSAIYREDEKLRDLVDAWTKSTAHLEILMQDLNYTTTKVVSEPTKRFSAIFPAVQQAVKKREQSLQEYNKCQAKVDKYLERERTGPNLVKLEASRKAFAAAKAEFEAQNSLLMEEMPRLYEGRVLYFQPSLQALIKAQMRYYSAAQTIYNSLCQQLTESGGDVSAASTDDDVAFKQNIQQKLSEIRALSITADDQPS